MEENQIVNSLEEERILFKIENIEGLLDYLVDFSYEALYPYGKKTHQFLSLLIAARGLTKELE